MAEKYRQLGERAVISTLPRVKTGNQVAIGPFQDHSVYLKSANHGSYRERFRDYAVGVLEINGGHEIITIPTSPYVKDPNSTHLMLVSVMNTGKNGEQVPTFFSFPKEQGQVHFSILAKIAKSLQEKYGSNWFIGTSISPEENNRQAVQSVKTIHTHCVGLTNEEMENFTLLRDNFNLKRKKGQEPKGRKEMREAKRMLSDSFAQLGIDLLQDLVLSQAFWDKNSALSAFVEEKNPQLNLEYPKSYSLKLQGGLEAFSDPRLFTLTSAIDHRIKITYDQILDLLVEKKERDLFNRYFPRPEEERTKRILAFAKTHEIKTGTLEKLKRLSRILLPATNLIARGINNQQQIYLANTRLFLKGPAYNHLLYPAGNGPQLILSIIPRFLSGGSPLDAMGIYKNQYFVSPEEIKTLAAQQKENAKEITRGIFP